MFSPSKKIIWLCPHCRSPHITKKKIEDFIFGDTWVACECNSCHHRHDWTSRIKVSVQKYNKHSDLAEKLIKTDKWGIHYLHNPTERQMKIHRLRWQL